MQQKSLVLPESELWCIPVGIRGGSIDSGPRIGGRAPENIVPLSDSASYTYFLTIILMNDPYTEVSIFVSSLDCLLPVSGTIQTHGLVQIIVHGESRRGQVNPLASELSEHALSLEPEQQDWVYSDEGERIIAPFSKLGGRPYVKQPKNSLSMELSNAKHDNFRHFLQIDFPGGPHDADIVSGNWPFADGMFHVFCRPPFRSNDWLWLFEY